MPRHRRPSDAEQVCEIVLLRQSALLPPPAKASQNVRFPPEQIMLSDRESKSATPPGKHSLMCPCATTLRALARFAVPRLLIFVLCPEL